MIVVTRSGKREPLDLRMIKDKLANAVHGIPGVSQEEIELDINNSALFKRDGMTTTEINSEVIKVIVNKIDYDKPNYTFVAARMVLNDMYHEVGHVYDSPKGNAYSHSFASYLRRGLNEEKLIDFNTWFTSDEIHELGEFITPNKDTDIIIHEDGRVEGTFTYLGIKTYLDKYATYTYDKKLMELPQHMFMAISMFLHAKEKQDRIQHIKDFYEAISSFDLMMATPTLSNARTPRHQLSSCFIGTHADQLAPEEKDPNHTMYDGIYGAQVEMAILSKFGGGIGWDWTNVRASESEIDGFQDVAGGVVPFLHDLNGLPLAVDQLGVRKGAIAVYLEPWHLDIEGFLDLKKTGGEERLRAHDLFPAVWLNDEFMRRVDKDEDWTLLDPFDAPDLHMLYGDAFDKAYLKYEKDDSIRKRVVKAKDIWKRILSSYIESGMPFMGFKDTANNANMNQHVGSILSTNLCTEIFQVTAPGRTAICNLGSVNWAKMKSKEHIVRTARILTRALDNVIDMNLYPIMKIEKTAKASRAIGVGVMGEAEMIAHEGIMYGSDEHLKFIDEKYGILRKAVEDMSHELALEKGSYPEFEGSRWTRPMRNGYLMAIAPTSSISILVGTTQSTEPVYKKKWFEENLSGLIPVTAPGINPDNYNLYVNAYEVDQLAMVRAAAVRQKHVDQGMSLNIFVDPENITGKYLSSIYMLAWKLGLKSTYYLRSLSPDEEKGLSIPDRSMECSGCQ